MLCIPPLVSLSDPLKFYQFIHYHFNVIHLNLLFFFSGIRIPTDTKLQNNLTLICMYENCNLSSTCSAFQIKELINNLCTSFYRVMVVQLLFYGSE